MKKYPVIVNGSCVKKVVRDFGTTDLQDAALIALNNAYEELKVAKESLQTKLGLIPEMLSLVDFDVSHTVNIFPYETSGVTVAIVYTIKASIVAGS